MLGWVHHQLVIRVIVLYPDERDGSHKVLGKLVCPSKWNGWVWFRSYNKIGSGKIQIKESKGQLQFFRDGLKRAEGKWGWYSKRKNEKRNNRNDLRSSEN